MIYERIVIDPSFVLTCIDCGSLVSDTDSSRKSHDDWHQKLNPRADTTKLGVYYYLAKEAADYIIKSNRPVTRGNIMTTFNITGSQIKGVEGAMDELFRIKASVDKPITYSRPTT